MTPQEILSRAADILTPRGAWTQGVYARTNQGESEVKATHSQACKWCMLGAMQKVAGKEGDYVRAVNLLSSIVPDRDVPRFNDTHSRRKSECIAKLREAAAL